ncbi:MAG: pyridoxal phosphate-dependent aminotransferase [Thermoprotei archaeon]|nr:MAG: pyridoxal phosphate-dependent aminotransferase [Thermoprotei archaeon]
MPAFRISASASKMGAEEAFVYLAKGLELKRKGVDVVSFGIGQPDFQPPQHVIEAAKKAMDEGHNGYGPSTGLPELREAIASFLNDRYGTDIKSEEVIVTVGAKSAVFMAMITLLEPGDEVIMPDPSYPLYESVAKYVGAVPVFLRLGHHNNYSVKYEELEKLVTDKTRMIVLNYPHNPVGSSIDKKDILDILDLAHKKNIVVLSDEIYDFFVYEGEHFSTLEYEGWRDILYYVNGFSKTFGMTGWRLGYVVTNRELVSRLSVVANNIYSCPVTFAQYGAIAALKEGMEWFKDIYESFRRRRDLIYSLLKNIDGVRVTKPRGAFYIFPDFTEVIKRKGLKDEREFADKLLEEKGVVTLPGTAFPKESGKGHLRFSFAVSEKDIERGLERIEEWVS